MSSKSAKLEHLIFNWSKDRMTWLYLLGFLIFSITIHGAGFYLFQVVYPSPVRIEPDLNSISIMDTSNPEVRSFFQRLRDRTVYLSPPSEESDVRVRLEEFQIRFTPAFQRTEVQPISPVFPWSLYSFGALPIDVPDEVINSDSAMSFDEQLSSREVAPWSIMGDYLARVESIPAFRAQIEVLPSGSVKVQRIEAELEEQDRTALIQVIESTLRFLPAKERHVGWMDVWAKG